MEALACGVRCSTTRKNKKTPFIHVGANMVVDITIKESLNVNRKKFTIAHELGHFYIPWHSELMFGCDIKEMDFKNDYVPREKEANMFAAELLMPIEEFKNFFSGKINYTMVSGLANIFDVSFQAALNRCIDLANEDCIAICSINRCVKLVS